ncbi:hypothetical protein BGZ60DRAFT_347980, partial [Tricladium varicosporioides]
DISAQGGCYGSALHQAVVRLLFAKGVDVNAQGGFYVDQAIVELLLAKGADFDAQGGRYYNALQAASSKGRQAVAKLLL